MVTDYTELQRLAEGATKGDWHYGPGDGDEEGPVVFVDLPKASSSAISILFEADWATEVDAKFVSKASPKTVLALIAENKALHEFIQGLAEYDAQIACAYAAIGK